MNATSFGPYQLTDSLLVESAIQGDLEAFNELVIEYQDIAYNLAFRIIGNRAAAEDAVQDAFISAYRKLSSFRYGSFKAWLLRIVTNACYDELRRIKRNPVIILDTVGEEDANLNSSELLVDDTGSPEEISLNLELSSKIQDGLSAMQLDFRSVLVLVDLLELSYLDASKILDVPIGTIKSRLLRARTRMKYHLAGYLNPLETYFNDCHPR